MPISKQSGESKDKFISRCMSAEAGKFPDEKQRYAVCIGYWGDANLVKDAKPITAASNEANRAIVAEYWGLGPEKASEHHDANPDFWDSFAKAMMVDTAESRRMLCANCEYFNNTTEAMALMDAVPMDAFDNDGGGRGYCEKFDFICHNLRTCRDWEPKEFDAEAVLQDCNSGDTNSRMAHKFVDSAKIGTVKRTSEGYVVARAKAVRSGVQDYLASELGLMGNHIVRVMRPEEEVFAADSIQSFVHAPVTIEHPAELVDADNWSKLAVGEVGSGVLRDGEFLALDLMLKDAAAIRAFDGGKKELSAGYTAEIEFVDGAEGYDAIMRNIRINHLALVDKARAGYQARIGDGAANQWGAAPLTTAKEVPTMEMKAVAIGDKAIQVAATDADALKKLLDEKDEFIGQLKAEVADAKAKILSDEEIEAKAQAIADMKAMREKVKEVFGDEAAKEPDAEIRGMFKVIDKAPKLNDTARAAIGDAMKGKADAPDEWDQVITKMKKGK